MNTQNQFWMIAWIGCFAACLAVARSPLASETQHENFDSDPVAGWEFSCKKQFVPAGEGRFLHVSGGGHALSVVERDDFSLTFRYRSESAGGVGDILFRASEQGAYSLRLEPQQIVLCWRTGNHEDGFQEQDLAVKPYPLQPDMWHTMRLRVQGKQIDVSVDGKPLVSCSDPELRPAGMVGLGVIATTGSVDYDDVAFAAPGPGGQSEAVPPDQPQAPGEPPRAEKGGSDLAVTDIYATRLRQGEVWIRITNRGPEGVVQQPVRLITRIGDSSHETKVSVTLSAGQTEAYNTGCMVDTSQQAANVTATIEPLGMRDPQAANNTYAEVVPRAAPQAPAKPGTPAPPQPGAGSSERVNLAVVNLRIDPQNIIHVHLENRSGMMFKAKPAEFILVQNGKALVVGPLEIPNIKPKERFFCNTGVKADWSGDKQLHITATVRVPGWQDQQPQDNTSIKVFKK